MINLERDTQYLQTQENRSPYTGTAGATQKCPTVSELVRGEKVKAIYGIPVKQSRLARYFSPEFFAGVYNPLGLDLHGLTQGLIDEVKKEDGFYDEQRDSRFVEGGKVVVLTHHASDFANPQFLTKYLNVDERTIVIAGGESLVSGILEDGANSEPTFTHFEYEGKVIPLFKNDGTSFLLHGIFDQLPNPLPPGSILRFLNNEYILEAKVLPIPQDLIVPQLSLLGPAEYSNLDRMLVETQARGGRIIVAFKEGHEGLVNGFIQAAPGFDVYELEDVDRMRIKRYNGRPVQMENGLLDIEEGKVQVIAVPIIGGIEDYICKGIAGIRQGVCRTGIPHATIVYGIDVVETGNSASKAFLVPIDFRRDGSKHPNGKTLLGWHRDDPGRYLEYVRSNAIMPVQPVAIRVRRGSIGDRVEGVELKL